MWDKNTGEPVYHAIVWQCRRTAEYADSLKEKGLTETFRKKTGLVIDAYFSATKLKWLLDNVPGAREPKEASFCLEQSRHGLYGSSLRDRCMSRIIPMLQEP